MHTEPGATESCPRRNAASICPVILSGGSAARLWRLSRPLQASEAQPGSLADTQAPILVAQEDHRDLLEERLRSVGVKPRSIQLEPFGRNTAPSVAIAGKIPLEVIEVQSGAYLAEDDIVRIEDAYHRV
jgi:mannose-1-phosphate guanylyltransferase